MTIEEMKKETEILKLKSKEIRAIRRQFESITRHLENKNQVVVKDWLDDSVQIKTLKED